MLSAFDIAAIKEVAASTFNTTLQIITNHRESDGKGGRKDTPTYGDPIPCRVFAVAQNEQATPRVSDAVVSFHILTGTDTVLGYGVDVRIDGVVYHVVRPLILGCAVNRYLANAIL